MSYQGAMNSFVSSTAGSISIARLVYQNSPEGKARLEQKVRDADVNKLKSKSDKAQNQTGGIGEAVRQEAEQKYLETGDERYQIISEFTQDADERYQQQLVDERTKAAESALNAEKQQKRQKTSWRDMTASGLTDRLGMTAKEIVEKEKSKNG